MFRIVLSTIMLAACLNVGLPVLSSTDEAVAADFKGKTITMILGTRPGGRRDRIARTIAKHLGANLPGQPTILVQNVPGGKGIPAQLKFSKSRPDGSVVGIVVSSDMEAPYFGAPGATYKPREYKWVGSVRTGKLRNVLFTAKKAGFNSIDDLRSREVALGAQGVGHRSYLYGRLMAEVLGLKVRWVLGYSTPEMYLAMEKGEIDGRVNDSASFKRDRPDWIEKQEVVAHVAMSLPENLPPIPGPLFAKTPALITFTDKEVHKNLIRKMNATSRLGGSVALPPGTPEPIRAAYEKALVTAGKDPRFKKDWEKFVGIRPYAGVADSAEVWEAVKIYTDWKPEIMKEFKRLGHQPPK